MLVNSCFNLTQYKSIGSKSRGTNCIFVGSRSIEGQRLNTLDKSEYTKVEYTRVVIVESKYTKVRVVIIKSKYIKVKVVISRVEL